MEAIFTHAFTVDENPENYIRHVNNLRYLEWFIDTAIEHAAALGWGMQECKKRSLAWVAKSHHIEYITPALQGDRLLIYTWIHKLTKTRVIRRYKCIREEDKKLVATAETLWIIVDYETGRPSAIPADLLEKFVIVAEADEP